MIKRITIVFAALAAMFISTPVTADDFVDIETSLVSRYVWRGSAGSDAVSIQPSLTLPIDTNVGATNINIWGNVPWSGANTEYNFSITQDINEYGNIGITSYYYDGAFLEGDSHDLEVGVSTSIQGISLFAGRFVSGDDVKDDTYVELGYELDGIDLHIGAGDGSYVADGDGFALVNLGLSASNDDGYGASLIYNPDSEAVFFVVSKVW